MIATKSSKDSFDDFEFEHFFNKWKKKKQSMRFEFEHFCSMLEFSKLHVFKILILRFTVNVVHSKCENLIT